MVNVCQRVLCESSVSVNMWPLKIEFDNIGFHINNERLEFQGR